MTEKRHPTRDELDAVSKGHPIILFQITSQVMAGITPETPNPEGGVIQRMADGKTPNGVVEEQAYFLYLKLIPAPTPKRAVELVQDGLRKYASEGITTAIDGASFVVTIKLLRSWKRQESSPLT